MRRNVFSASNTDTLTTTSRERDDTTHRLIPPFYVSKPNNQLRCFLNAVLSVQPVYRKYVSTTKAIPEADWGMLHHTQDASNSHTYSTTPPCKGKFSTGTPLLPAIVTSPKIVAMAPASMRTRWHGYHMRCVLREQYSINHADGAFHVPSVSCSR